MQTQTWIFLALGAAGVYALTRKRKMVVAVIPEGFGKPSAPPPPAKGAGPAWCDTPGVFAEQADAMKASFDRAWDAFGFQPGGFSDMQDARVKAHALAVWVMEDTCPQLPRPAELYQVDNYADKYGKPWSEAYDAPYNWAWGRLVQMPV